MQRILKDTAPTISTTFYVDGVATDPAPDTATVTITRADGTVLVTDDAATTGAAGVFSYTLTTTHTELLDTLTVAWTSALGTITEILEVAGGFLFTIAEARALKPLDDTTKYPTAAITAMRTTVEQSLEDACGVAFVPRYALETINGARVRWPYVRSIRSVTVDTVAYTAGQLALLAFSPYGALSGYTWAATAAVEVGYEHGHDFPPERVRQAALILARSWLVKGPVDDRALGQASPDGGFSFGLAVPGRGGSVFGVPEVDAVVNQYSLVTGIA